MAALLAPSIQNGATLARSDAMSEPVLALSAAIVRLVGALHSGSLIGQPGYGARCGVTACPARAGACRHFLEVPQDYGHPVRFAKMSGLRRPTGAAGHAACSSRCKNAKLFGRAAKTLAGDLPSVARASAYPCDKELCTLTYAHRAFPWRDFRACGTGSGDVG